MTSVCKNTVESEETSGHTGGRAARSAPSGGAPPILGYLDPAHTFLPCSNPAAGTLIARLPRPVYVLSRDGELGFAAGTAAGIAAAATNGALPVLGYSGPCPLEHLGDPVFRADHGLEYAYYSGAMANGIASVALVEAMGRNGLLGFFGAAGLAPGDVEAAVDELARRLGDRPYGFNLIHSPNEPDLEAAVADLYIRRGVRLVEASAFLGLTLPVVRYRTHGIQRDASGRVIAPNQVIAKVSREEVAAKFLSPPPETYLRELVATGDLTQAQAEMASTIPMAQDLTAEADSGGHTDNRPAVALLPTLLSLRDRLQDRYGYAKPPRVGLAGGIATPASAAAAFAMGAAYVVTGSINQACVESGSSDTVRRMLAEARQADIAMAPAADMFEMGVQVQVLKRGTMFSMRGAKLYDLYRRYPGIDQVPAEERAKIEQTIFREPLEETWKHTRAFFIDRDPKQVQRAERDPKHKMALIFRSYLGRASHWANRGEPSRKIDYQIWCGPAMGAFNEWARGSFLEAPENRKVVTVAKNIFYGAAVLMRCNGLRSQGFPLPPGVMHRAPLELGELEEFLC